jgi:hypothetical protein
MILSYEVEELLKNNILVKSPLIVMPDLIRHPETPIELAGFRLSPE